MIHHKIYTTVSAIPKTWETLAVNDIFLQKTYLKSIESAAPNNISLYYVGVFKNDTLVGIALVQRVQLYLKDLFRTTKVSCLKTLAQNALSKVLKGNVLVVGNVMHTGQHGIAVDQKQLSVSEFYTEIFNAIAVLKGKIKTEFRKTVRIILFKDFFKDDSFAHLPSLKQQALHTATVQPNMVMPIRAHWDTTAAYVANMTKKYRSRYKRARKKLDGVVCKELDLNTIKLNAKQLHALYLNVSKNASINTFTLPEQHFLSFKTHLGDRFKVFGYYLDQKLIGFFTLLENGKNLETYFLGYDMAQQQTHQLYLNMLYDMASYGIANGFSSIIYARTAMEIKSSVGAEARSMTLYLKHTNKVLNLALKPVFRFMNPKKDWQERHPFN